MTRLATNRCEPCIAIRSVSIPKTFLWASMLAVVQVACFPTASYQCANDEQCVDPGIEGRCESTGYCSFPDPSCSSGQRYSEYADDLGKTCVGDSGSGGDGTLVYQFTDCADLPGVASFSRSSSGFYVGEDGSKIAGLNEPRCEYAASQPQGILIEESTSNFASNASGLQLGGLEGFALGWDPEHDINLSASATLVPSQDYPGFNETHISFVNNGPNDESFGIVFNVESVSQRKTYTQSWNSRILSGAEAVSSGALRVAYFDQNFNSIGQGQTDGNALPLTTAWRHATQTFDTPNNTRILQVSYRHRITANSSAEISVVAPQVETGTLVTSPIASNGNALSRSADMLELATTEFSSTSEGTLVVDADLRTRSDRSQVLLSGLTSGEIDFAVYRDDSTGAWNLRRARQRNSADGDTLETDVPAPSGRVKIALHLKDGLMSLAINGSLVAGALEVASFGELLQLGRGEDDDDALQGHIRSLSYFAEDLPGDRLRELTTP